MELHERIASSPTGATVVGVERQRERSLRRAEEPDPSRARQRARAAPLRRRGQRRRSRPRRVRDRRPARVRRRDCRATTGGASRPRSPTTSSATARSSACSPTRRSRRSWSTARRTSGSSVPAGCRRPTLTFTDASHLRRIITKMVGQIGRRIDESSPLVDARLPDGSRVNAIIPPLSLSGPLLTIRKFAQNRFAMSELIEHRHALEGGGGVPPELHPRPAEHAHLGRHRLGQDDVPERPVGGDSRQRPDRHDRGRGRAPARPAARAPPRVAARRTSRARARSRFATSSGTLCACAPIGSSSARCAARRRSTCSRR